MSKTTKSTNESISIASLGVLELNMHLTLNQSQLTSLGVKSEHINEFSDLSAFLSKDNPKLLDKIVLLTSNSLLNSLLFINRSFKTKTLIELITTNEIYFPPEHAFFKAVLTYVTDKSFLFIFSNRITNKPSSITFTLKIINDDTGEIQQKFFSIGRQTVAVDKELRSCSENLFDELAYRFSRDYFICSFEDLLQITQNKNSAELISFFSLLIKNSPTIHIITLFLSECLTDISDDSVLDIMKEIIDYSDIVIAEKSILQRFYKLYGKKYSNYLSNCSLEEAIIQDAFSKKRTEIVKITLLLDKLKTATIVMQESYSHRVLFNATHVIKFSSNNHHSSMDVITNVHLNFLTTAFIGGFLSRLLHFKTFNTCLVAGGKVVSKVINHLASDELETVYNKEAYEVVVHMCNKTNTNNRDKEKEFANRKKKGFVLDCLNYGLSQLKPYNAICDYNCANFVNSRNKLWFLKQQGFINRKGALLKDPQLIREPFDKKDNYLIDKRPLEKINIENRMRLDTFYMNKTWKEPKMTFAEKRVNSPRELPMMNKTHQTSLRNNTSNSNQGKKAVNKFKDRNWHLEKEKLNEIILKYENKASSEIRNCNNE